MSLIDESLSRSKVRGFATVGLVFIVAGSSFGWRRSESRRMPIDCGVLAGAAAGAIRSVTCTLAWSNAVAGLPSMVNRSATAFDQAKVQVTERIAPAAA